VAHSSTDVPIARMFHVDHLVGIPEAHTSGASGVPETAEGAKTIART
jgi:hypothetical protein